MGREPGPDSPPAMTVTCFQLLYPLSRATVSRAAARDSPIDLRLYLARRFSFWTAVAVVGMCSKFALQLGAEVQGAHCRPPPNVEWRLNGIREKSSQRTGFKPWWAAGAD